MSEIVALARLLITRSRTALTLAIAYMLVIHISAALFSVGVFSDGDVGGQLALKRTATMIVVMFSLPLLGITFALFDFSERADVSGGATGYLPWLLRMPVKTWKLAAVPLGLKTLWTLAICGAIAMTARFFGTPLERWFMPAIGIATLFVLACVITWHPFRWSYTRAFLIGILFVPAYAWLIVSVSFAFADKRSDLPSDTTSIAAAWIVGLSAYTALTLLALRAVRLARFHVAGRISESAGWLATADPLPSVGADATSEASFLRPARVSPIAALVRFEASKFAGTGAKIIVAGWLLIVLFFSLFSYAGTDSLVFLVVALLFPGIFMNEWKNYGLQQRFLPNTLAVAPIATTTLVWTQQLIATAIWFASLLGVPIVFAIWSFNGASAPLIRAWQRAIGPQFETPDADWKLTLVAAVIGVLLVLRQTTWNIAAQSTESKRFVYWTIAAKFAVAFFAFSWFLYQFLRFPDWEAWTLWAWQCIAQLPTLLPWLAIVKGILVVTATTMLYRSGLTRRRTVVGLLVGYLVCTFATAAVVWQWMPSDRVLLWHCLTAAAVLMPYSRIVLAPLCLAHSRHA
ncbi:hypothetical protein [Planctomycetes bacterium TBK1r]|uniref:ABC-2 family transporter protein n=1 Tax=Stieleria magnilauensis TaxID=2527963 RepID=A0ABX5Y1X1_9BACT|nr:hypothetical protein TBK1r_68140 [Planctomycetes bacterium TBK1r]